MEISQIKNFSLIEDKLRKIRADLFYYTPCGEEAIAPIETNCLHNLFTSTTISYNPTLENKEFLIKCLFNINIQADKNYDFLEVIKGQDIWILYNRLPDGKASIMSVQEAIHE